MRQARHKGANEGGGRRGVVAHESCQRLIFPSVVGALIDKSRGSRRARRLPLDS